MQETQLGTISRYIFNTTLLKPDHRLALSNPVSSPGRKEEETRCSNSVLEIIININSGPSIRAHCVDHQKPSTAISGMICFWPCCNLASMSGLDLDSRGE